MKNFLSVKDAPNPAQLVQSALELKKSPFSSRCGERKTLGLIFFNPSLRTRLSTQKAAMNLGMNVMVMNIDKEGWQIEFEDGAIMDGGTQEHIKDAVNVISQYVDVLGVRTFAGLQNREEDYNEKVLQKFVQHATVPVISLESATLHPLQSLADLVTIKEHSIQKPKVVLSWAPHPRALPQAVPNSFLEWIKTTDADITLACPEGYDLAKQFTAGINIVHDQHAAFEGADFIYAKNWSSYQQYGQRLDIKENWMVDGEKMARTNNGKFMHCLPIRRNVIATDEVLDSSIIYQEAGNREWAAQAVLKTILENT